MPSGKRARPRAAAEFSVVRFALPTAGEDGEVEAVDPDNIPEDVDAWRVVLRRVKS